MSVTFSIEGNATGRSSARCYSTGTVLRADSYELILEAIAVHKLSCEDCAMGGMYAEAEMDVPEELDVNLANGNAAMVLSALGMDSEDLCGMAHAECFLGAVLLALAVDRDESAVPAVEMPRPVDDEGREFGARMIVGGLPEGYMGSTLRRLHDLAVEANRLGRHVTWA